MIRPILKYGDHVLHDPARAVEAITGDVSSIITDMVDTMYAAPGIGLAAPQIGGASHPKEELKQSHAVNAASALRTRRAYASRRSSKGIVVSASTGSWNVTSMGACWT